MVNLRRIEQDQTDFGPAFSPEETQAMQRAIVRLFDLWGVTDGQASILLGDISARTYQRWKQGSLGRVNRDLASRLSNLIGIHKALRLLFSDTPRAHEWVRLPNKDFAGASALEVMLEGNLTDLMRVRRYLDSQRGAW